MKAKVTPIKWRQLEPLKTIQKIPKPHTGKARNKGTIENDHSGHCTHNWESANVDVQNV
jgi:hypothetical protein